MVRTKKAAIIARRLKKQRRKPLDPTPWEELSKNVKGKFVSKIHSVSLNNFESEPTDKIKIGLDTSFDLTHLKLEHDNENKQNNTFLKNSSMKNNYVTSSNIDGQESLSVKQLPKYQGKKKKRKSKLLSPISIEKSDLPIQPNYVTSSNIDGQESLSVTQLPKYQGKKKKRKSNLLSPISIEKSDLPIQPNYVTSSNMDDQESVSVKQLSKYQRETKKKKSKLHSPISIEKSDLPIQPEIKKLSDKKRLQRKKLYEQKRLMRRKELGIMLLPKNIENRLLRLRKTLRKKKLPPEEIKSIMRRERNKAQNEFRKSHSAQICYNCREPGHVLANCPTNDTNNISICVKCGSTEHKYTACTKQVDGFPFATCFICKDKGHISRDCPNNEHGIYPKGGKCNLCDSINHLKKDCPTLKKNKASPITLYTIDNGTSIDDEVMDIAPSPKKFKSKEPKVVTF